MTNRNQIADTYDAGVDYEYTRLTRGSVQKAEFELTADLLVEYIAPGSTVADIGAGPGRYAEFLLRRNCKLGLVDLSERCLQHFAQRMDEALKERVLFTRVACATNLEGIETEAFDAVLLMGPLYHLTEEHERRSAIAEARRILKSGGYMFATFISPFPRLVRLVGHNGSRLRDTKYLADLLEHGLTRMTVEGHTVEQYRCWPRQAIEMMENGGFETVRVRALEGIASFLSEQEQRILENPEVRDKYFSILHRTCENRDLLGATLHFLYVGRKSA